MTDTLLLGINSYTIMQLEKAIELHKKCSVRSLDYLEMIHHLLDVYIELEKEKNGGAK